MIHPIIPPFHYSNFPSFFSIPYLPVAQGLVPCLIRQTINAALTK